jgi:hypothetical protein
VRALFLNQTLSRAPQQGLSQEMSATRHKAKKSGENVNAQRLHNTHTPLYVNALYANGEADVRDIESGRKSAVTSAAPVVRGRGHAAKKSVDVDLS